MAVKQGKRYAICVNSDLTRNISSFVSFFFSTVKKIKNKKLYTCDHFWAKKKLLKENIQVRLKGKCEHKEVSIILIIESDALVYITPYIFYFLIGALIVYLFLCKLFSKNQIYHNDKYLIRIHERKKILRMLGLFCKISLTYLSLNFDWRNKQSKKIIY